jgi:lipoprotein signal peptidase
MIFAQVKRGVVVNVTVWDQDPQMTDFVNITGLANVGIGWSYADGQFIEPVQPEPEPEPTQEQPE